MKCSVYIATSADGYIASALVAQATALASLKYQYKKAYFRGK
jgi:hypothetical protein